MSKYDLIVVGCGFCGAVIADLAARKMNRKVLIIERRKHIAGNMYDEVDENGILVQRYGPHIFHTNSDRVFEYLSDRFSWVPFQLKCCVEMDGKQTPSPFNFDTIDSFYSHEEAELLKKRLTDVYAGRDTVTIVEILKSSDNLIRAYGEMLFEKDYRPYTSKQWGIPPEEIDISVLQRVPVCLNYENRYFRDKYQLMPDGGFTQLFAKLIKHENIDIMLECDALQKLKLDYNYHVCQFDDLNETVPLVYTGAIDELFGYKYGKLPYRSLYFDYKTVFSDSYQSAPVVAYPQKKDFTRITEYRKLPEQNIDSKKSTIAIEYSLEFVEGADKGGERYYPIPNDINHELYKRYADDATMFKNLHLCGRLAEYKYYNMDAAIDRALTLFDKIIL